MHFIVDASTGFIAMAMDNVLNLFETEKRVKSDSFKNHGISQTHSFINVVFKVFHRKDGAGVLAEIKAFLKLKKNVENSVLYYVGKRFNLLFHNGGAVH